MSETSPSITGADVARRLGGEARSQAELAGIAERLSGENRVLTEQLSGMRDRLDRHQQELVRARRHLAEVEAENRALSGQYVSLAAQKADLARLHVASQLLHGSLDEGQVLAALGEIMINLVGTEEFAVLELDEAHTALVPLFTFGMDAARAAALPLGLGPVGGVARTGLPYVREGGDAGELAACIPLAVDGRVTGVVAVFSLLPQKPSFVPFDRELFELVTVQGGQALHAARLHARLRAAA